MSQTSLSIPSFCPVVPVTSYPLCRRTVGVRTVWILGAGASKAAYCGMPLVKNFMEEALHRLRLSGNQGSILLNFIRDTYGYEEPKEVNVEELLTFAWCDVSHLDSQRDSPLPEPEQLRLVHALDTLRKVEALIVAVLFQAQRECMQIGHRIHDSLAERVDKTQDTVISYNCSTTHSGTSKRHRRMTMVSRSAMRSMDLQAPRFAKHTDVSRRSNWAVRGSGKVCPS
jgi:hypothetical protein